MGRLRFVPDGFACLGTFFANTGERLERACDWLAWRLYRALGEPVEREQGPESASFNPACPQCGRLLDGDGKGTIFPCLGCGWEVRHA